MMQGHPLLARFAAVPSLIAPDMSERVERCLASFSQVEHSGAMLAERAASDDGFWPEPGSWRAAYRPYVVQAGILQIPVKGILLHDFSFAVGSFVTGYVYISRALDRGLSDPNVKGIALICDSPGGEVSGCFDLTDKIFAARATKKVRAFAHEFAYSAAYALASAADRLVVARTGGVGSIGVVTMHTDISNALDKAGVKVTLVAAPRDGHKTDGYPYNPLSASAEARMQDRVDALYDIFVTTVARNRNMKDVEVRATRALTFMAAQAKENRLADDVGSLDDAVAAFAADLSSNSGDTTMTDKTTAADKPAATFTQADLDRARAEGHTEGVKAGSAAERTRIAGILDHAEAKGRDGLARHYAFKTGETVEASAEAMKAAPKAEASAADPLRTLAAEANVPLGAAPAPAPPANMRAAWGKSVDRVNRARGFAS